MLGLLDKNDKAKRASAIIAMVKGVKPGFERDASGDVKESEDEGEVGPKDQMQVCAKRMIKAMKAGDVDALVKAMFQFHEASDEAIEAGIDIDEDSGEGEGEEGMEDDEKGW